MSLSRSFIARICGLVFALLAFSAGPLQAGQARVAVAANFLGVLRDLAPAFRAASGHRLRISAGSTGKLYAQIRNGAPFDVFLAADAERPRRLEAEGFAVPGSRFTYAEGRLVLWSPQAGRFADGLAWLRRGEFRRLALASPRTAPYGRAARQFLSRHGLWDRLSRRLVRGESVAQAYQFVATGAVEAGFVALAQLRRGSPQGGSRWRVPAADHAPIVQQAVLLKRGEQNPAARAFLAFLREPAIRKRITNAGYDLPDDRL